MVNKWLKLNASWMESEWIITLSAEARLAWIQLLCYTKTHGFSGRVKVKPAMVFARQSFIGEKAVEQMLRAAKKDGALEEQDGIWVITGWARHQGDETNAERQKRYRDRRNKTEEVFQRDAYRCVSCGSAENLCVDHILPVSLGGDTSMPNLQTLCQTCNKKKGNKFNGSVTNALQCNSNGRGEEKRGEEKRVTTPKPPGGTWTWKAVQDEFQRLMPETHHKAITEFCAYHRDLKTKPWVRRTVRLRAEVWGDWPAKRFSDAVTHTMLKGWKGLAEPEPSTGATGIVPSRSGPTVRREVGAPDA